MLLAFHSTGSGAHGLARNFSATVSEVSFGEAMGSTINGSQLLKLPDWGSKALRNSQKEKARANGMLTGGQALFKAPYYTWRVKGG